MDSKAPIRRGILAIRGLNAIGKIAYFDIGTFTYAKNIELGQRFVFSIIRD